MTKGDEILAWAQFVATMTSGIAFLVCLIVGSDLTWLAATAHCGFWVMGVSGPVSDDENEELGDED